MQDPNDTRNIGPAFGSPLWFYLTTVAIAGAVVLAAAVAHVRGLTLPASHPLFWVAALMIVAGEIWPIVTPGRHASESPVASITFGLAALLFWGFGVAVLLRGVAAALVSGAQRKAPHWIAFNVAQLTIALLAADAVLALFRRYPSPGSPWTPSGRELPVIALAGAAYFAVSYCLLCAALALHSRSPLIRTLRSRLRHQALLNLVMVATAPLVAVIMGTHSAVMLALFAFPVAATYASAAMSVRREHQAHHDELTGLSNRKLLLRRSAEVLEQAAAAGTRAGFLLLDLDRFKEVNDTLGHVVGDRLLRTVAQRLTHSIRPGDLVARLGGDEFAVLLPAVREPSVAREIASRLRAALSEPIRLDGISLDIEASVGIALFPDDAGSFDQLMQRADVAMYLAKERRSGIERYVAEADRNSPARLALLGELRRGLDHGELELHFQPKVALDGQYPVGMEALARWRHPRHGLLGPAEFISIAEQSYLMHELTDQVISLTLQQAARWWADAMPVQVSLNIAARDLIGSGLAELIDRKLRGFGLPASALMLEIDEQVLVSEPAHAITAATELAAVGLGLSLDGFGSGYSSLVRLRRLGVSEVKIDPLLIAGLPKSKDNTVIVKSIIDLARTLGIRSVAESVESAAVAAALRELGCDTAQGWHFARPLNAPSATAWLAERGEAGYGPGAAGARRPASSAAAPGG
jgi:diguanylate cyclase (GGDEF)-like protein